MAATTQLQTTIAILFLYIFRVLASSGGFYPNSFPCSRRINNSYRVWHRNLTVQYHYCMVSNWCKLTDCRASETGKQCSPLFLTCLGHNVFNLVLFSSIWAPPPLPLLRMVKQNIWIWHSHSAPSHRELWTKNRFRRTLSRWLATRFKALLC